MVRRPRRAWFCVIIQTVSVVVAHLGSRATQNPVTLLLCTLPIVLEGGGRCSLFPLRWLGGNRPPMRFGRPADHETRLLLFYSALGRRRLNLLLYLSRFLPRLFVPKLRPLVAVFCCLYSCCLWPVRCGVFHLLLVLVLSALPRPPVSPCSPFALPTLEPAAEADADADLDPVLVLFTCYFFASFGATFFGADHPLSCLAVYIPKRPVREYLTNVDALVLQIFHINTPIISHIPTDRVRYTEVTLLISATNPTSDEPSTTPSRALFLQ